MNSLTWTISEPILIDVDFDVPLDEMVRDAGFDWVEPMFNPADYPPPRSSRHQTAVQLLSFDRKMGIDGALNKIQQLGLRGADPRQMIRLITLQPTIETRTEILAPGTIVETWKMRRPLAFWIGIGGDGKGRRHLGFSSWGRESWLPGTKFLVEA